MKWFVLSILVDSQWEEIDETRATNRIAARSHFSLKPGELNWFNPETRNYHLAKVRSK